jgi:hypothetical protein
MGLLSGLKADQGFVIYAGLEHSSCSEYIRILAGCRVGLGAKTFHFTAVTRLKAGCAWDRIPVCLYTGNGIVYDVGCIYKVILT